MKALTDQEQTEIEFALKRQGWTGPRGVAVIAPEKVAGLMAYPVIGLTNSEGSFLICRIEDHGERLYLLELGKEVKAF